MSGYSITIEPSVRGVEARCPRKKSVNAFFPSNSYDNGRLNLLHGFYRRLWASREFLRVRRIVRFMCVLWWILFETWSLKSWDDSEIFRKFSSHIYGKAYFVEENKLSSWYLFIFWEKLLNIWNIFHQNQYSVQKCAHKLHVLNM